MTSLLRLTDVKYPLPHPPEKMPLKFKSVFVKPYNLAIAYFKLIGAIYKDQLVQFCWKTFSISNVVLYLLTGLALVLPIINSIVYAILINCSVKSASKEANDSLRPGLKPSHLPALPSHSSKQVKELAPVVIPDKAVELVCSRLDLLSLQTLSCIKAFSDKASFWQSIAKRLQIPLCEEITIKEKFQSLVFHFKINKDDGFFLPNQLKSTQSDLFSQTEFVKKLIEHYPKPSWICLNYEGKMKLIFSTDDEAAKSISVLGPIGEKDYLDEQREAMEDIMANNIYYTPLFSIDQKL